ncbi:type IV pilus assembly PilZ [Legionella busanensis]|uniref:Type IV pilus assembly PilZ n=1 Tax=Legionella busanensis TaxID=190655 RepID=A0A378JHU6_9GAMM|nr:PilZ domain-containing protein [Legionella busanensis]STX50765.1 type IV pilus assembly PilZ [Legionella busanensis]
MPVHERRQHFRIDDEIYFEYKVIEPGDFSSDKALTDELLGQSGQRYLETTRYFQSLDYELSKLTQTLAMKEPAIAHYLNLLNAKIDYLMRHLSIAEKTPQHKVNISLGGMAFYSKTKIKEHTSLKLVIYTKPKMVPIIVNAVVVYSQYSNNNNYRTAVQFDGLTKEQEQLLSQHIMLAQVQCRLD